LFLGRAGATLERERAMKFSTAEALSVLAGVALYVAISVSGRQF
jgi:hypothetical protein